MKQKILTFILIMSALWTSQRGFAYDFEVDGIYYNKTPEGAEVARSNNSANGGTYVGDIVIPSTVFYDGEVLDVTSIQDQAFFACNITTIKIPNSVKKIHYRAFVYCSKLTTVTLPDSITTIEGCLFEDCESLSSVNIPDGVTSIGEYAFWNCKNLTSLSIPNSVTTINKNAFGGCGIKSLTIPNNISIIREGTFQYCRNLSSIIISNNVTSIEKDAFKGCGLLTVEIPNSITTIGNGVFSECKSLVSVIIPNSITSISSNAFSGSQIKKTIWLTNTPPSGFSYAKGKINYVSNEQFGTTKDIVIYPFLSSIFEVNGIRYVPVSPYERTCDAIDCTYDYTTNTHINISSDVSYQGISMSVQKMQPYLCYHNMFIENLTCGNNGDIADYAFTGCTNMKNIVCNNSGTIGNNAFESCSNAESLALGDNIMSIGKNSFKDCSLLQTVTIPNAVTLLDDYSFSGCSSLDKIIIGNHVNTIGLYTFENCKLLQSVNIPNSVKTIDNYAFSGCTGLKTLIVADRDSELSLGKNGSSPLFTDCPLDSVYIGGNITYDTSSGSGYSPFYRNTSLRTVVITDKETEISPNEFYGCTNLQNFRIGDGVTSFGDWAFSSCSSLKSLSFGTQLKTIGKEVFSDCTAVTKIYSKTVTPPTCGVQALDDINKWNCTLYVPLGSLASYQAADQWKEFFFMEEGTESSGVTHILADDLQIDAENGEIHLSGIDEGTNIAIYSVSGQKVGSMKANGNQASLATNFKKGEVAIIKIGEKSIKVVMQ